VVQAPESPARRERLSVVALLLGVSPALAATTGVHALVLAAAIILILVLSVPAVRLACARMKPRGALAVHIAVVGILLPAADLALQAWLPALRRELGVSFPLAAAGCVIVGRAVDVGRARSGARALAQAAGAGIGVGACLVAVACVREALGSGAVTLLRVGSFSGVLTLPVLARNPAAVARQAAGGLLVLGFLMGLARWVSLKRRKA
jgi:Na+-translocating ferredoxin:NAD+ oxidoreductase subunit E